MMPQRAFWKGYLKLSLVTCPVAMVPAVTDSDKVRFHTLNRKTGHRVTSQYVDGVSGKAVDEDDEVKGYEKGEDDYVILEDEELEAVALESTRTIDIASFVPRSAVDWIYYDKPHYLTPDDEVGAEAFAVIREAMKASGVVGLSSLVMYRRERAILLEARGPGIVVWTLREQGSLREAAEHRRKGARAKPDAKLIGLVTSLIDERTSGWDPAMASDPVQDRLLEIIASKKKGRKRPPKPKAQASEPQTGNVINIMDALKRSLAKEGKARGRG